ncbi:MAG TPA: hypothetical protein VM531_12240 [Sphingomicrobium sp.]|nr:hypothetical protein [Sphingomicrobium sp.]
MFEYWGEFYLLVGSAAAVLIGLIFVVVTLMQDKPRSTMLSGSRYYMGPVVLNVSFVLVLSAAALVADITPAAMAIVCADISVWGFARSAMSFNGIRTLVWDEEPPNWTDAWFYGAIPATIYIALAAVAVAFWTGQPWAPNGVAVVINAILVVSIRNEWDLVTWLAPRGDAKPS